MAFPAKGGFVVHDVRHSYGTLTAELGCTPNEIKEWMGHANLSTTERYMHYSPRREAARRFSEGVGAELGESVSRNVPRTAHFPRN